MGRHGAGGGPRAEGRHPREASGARIWLRRRIRETRHCQVNREIRQRDRTMTFALIVKPF